MLHTSAWYGVRNAWETVKIWTHPEHLLHLSGAGLMIRQSELGTLWLHLRLKKRKKEEGKRAKANHSLSLYIWLTYWRQAKVTVEIHVCDRLESINDPTVPTEERFSSWKGELFWKAWHALTHSLCIENNEFLEKSLNKFCDPTKSPKNPSSSLVALPKLHAASFRCQQAWISTCNKNCNSWELRRGLQRNIIQFTPEIEQDVRAP